MRVYVASSWRNEDQPAVVSTLRAASHEVYDFRNPEPGDHGFDWAEIDPDWQNWTSAEFLKGLDHPAAQRGFKLDRCAMQWAEVFLLLLPCGRSAHLELGWAVGARKITVVLLNDECEPELMYKLVDHICVDLAEVVAFLKDRWEN